jgi:hypothetical protein
MIPFEAGDREAHKREHGQRELLRGLVRVAPPQELEALLGGASEPGSRASSIVQAVLVHILVPMSSSRSRGRL